MAIVVGAAFLLTAVFAAYAYLQKAKADYVRVCTDRQAEQGVSLEAQEAKIRGMEWRFADMVGCR